MIPAAAVAVQPERVVLPVEGMTCATCVGRVEKALTALPGVRASVNLSSEQAEIEFDPTHTNPYALTEAIEHAGYDVPRERRDLTIAGMTCATCAGRIEAALKGVSGVTRVDVNLASERASIEGFAGLLRPAVLINAVRAAGYDAGLITGDRERDRQLLAAEDQRRRRELWRTFAAIALSAPLLLPMFGVSLPGWLTLLLATPVQFVIGGHFYSGAWKALRAGTGNMDLLVSLGTSAAYFFSLYLLLFGPAGSHLYFEAAAVVIA